VRKAYRAGGLDFIMKVLQSPGVLESEEVTGIAKMLQEADDMGDFACDSDEDW